MTIDPHLEFHRHAVARLPSPDDRHPGVAFFVPGKPSQEFCTCHPSSRRTCPHLKALFKSMADTNSSLEAEFSASIWYHLATILGQGDLLTPETTTVRMVRNGDRTTLRVIAPQGTAIIAYGSTGDDRNRLAERLGAFAAHGNQTVPDRSDILRRLQLLTMTDGERQLHDLKMKSRRQAFEGSLWFRFAYHCFMEFGPDACRLHPSINEKTGAFMVTCRDGNDAFIAHISVARDRVRPLLACLRRHLPNQHNLPIHPIPLKSIFRVSQTTETDLDVLPVIRLIQSEGEDRFFSREGLEKFIYHDLVYIPELKMLAELEKPGATRRFTTPRRMTFKRYQIPGFLETVGDDLNGDEYFIDPDVKGLQLLSRWDTQTLSPNAIDRSWCWLSVEYGFGDERISLAEILRTREAGTRYIGTSAGWIDTRSPAMGSLIDLAGNLPAERFSRDGRSVKLSPQEIFQLCALEATPPTVVGRDDHASALTRLLQREPTDPPEDPGLASSLRDYQKVGLKWLWWLWENRLGGLLCDDMGLGKTHQVMALITCIKNQANQLGPILVVCPTTVISHWIAKIKQHAPTLAAAAYYGTDRDLAAELQEADVLITSYGLLLRDVDVLEGIGFCLVVLDEMQQIKNAETKTYQAAAALDATVKIGLSGTPIENSVMELKALMDVVVPGYLGSTAAFSRRYAVEAMSDMEADRNREHLRRLIHPFILRRMKRGVLEELPEKIEDLRFCELTDRQVKLYRDAIDTRARGILSALQDTREAVPYIHIFALLTLLKQICNHPALVDKQTVDSAGSVSGKWELFIELLTESLESGQKVVVYSQFTEMIAIIADYLTHHEIGHVVLTGASRKRGRLVDAFNTDPACRVFLGSLKAGGTGIDLVAGSVVIHYDRWWNAAKEDQATDRVHRIGQRRGVQVFKLVTIGTLEEKISAIIEKKRQLMADIVREDDPGLLKSFTRQELLEFLCVPD